MRLLRQHKHNSSPRRIATASITPTTIPAMVPADSPSRDSVSVARAAAAVEVGDSVGAAREVTRVVAVRLDDDTVALMSILKTSVSESAEFGALAFLEDHFKGDIGIWTRTCVSIGTTGHAWLAELQARDHDQAITRKPHVESPLTSSCGCLDIRQRYQNFPCANVGWGCEFL